METFKQIEFPAPYAARLIAEGAEPVSAYEWTLGDHFAFATVAKEPSGPDGKCELHLCLSTSSAGKPRWARDIEVTEALNISGFGHNCTSGIQKPGMVHFYKEIPSE